jgi:hypothetical protein
LSPPRGHNFPAGLVVFVIFCHVAERAGGGRWVLCGMCRSRTSCRPCRSVKHETECAYDTVFVNHEHLRQRIALQVMSSTAHSSAISMQPNNARTHAHGQRAQALSACATVRPALGRAMTLVQPFLLWAAGQGCSLPLGPPPPLPPAAAPGSCSHAAPAPLARLQITVSNHEVRKQYVPSNPKSADQIRRTTRTLCGFLLAA